MKLAVLIRAHKAPIQLAQLVRALDHDQIDTFAHIDLKVDQRPFEAAIATSSQTETMQFITARSDLTWGGFSMVQATLKCLREVMSSTSGTMPDYVALLSGQDYPILSNERILGFLDDNAGKQFVSYAACPTPFWKDETFDRVKDYNFVDLKALTWPANKNGSLTRRWPLRLRLANKIANILSTGRTPPTGWTMYGGSAWWILSRDAVEYILQTIDSNPEISRYFRWSFHSEEMFYQSILMNSPFRDDLIGPHEEKLIGDYLWYQQWSSGSPSPDVLGSDDLGRVLASDRMFARKFDIASDAAVLDAIDRAREQA
ncbi:MAG: beta-1,6-N-acetylglucosaminyltransferase [Alphaproteobacteria bacterium]